jgi:hypothetical protein
MEWVHQFYLLIIKSIWLYIVIKSALNDHDVINILKSIGGVSSPILSIVLIIYCYKERSEWFVINIDGVSSPILSIIYCYKECSERSLKYLYVIIILRSIGVEWVHQFYLSYYYKERSERYVINILVHQFCLLYIVIKSALNDLLLILKSIDGVSSPILSIIYC